MFSLIEQKPITAGMLSVQASSAVNLLGQNNTSSLPRDGVENGAFLRAESLVYLSKKLENDMQSLGKRISQHEENIKYLKSLRNSLDHVITEMQVTLDKSSSSSKHMTEGGDLSHMQSMEATVKHILQHEKSAAGILCQVKCHGNHAAQISSTKDVLGVVATLGKVDDVNLSRLLSEYLGLDTMLALVCMTYDGVKALETFDAEGSINKRAGLYGLGASIGRILDGRFDVICLQNLRLYAGEIMPDDTQRRLALLKPKLANGESPAGFLGFAVNMIHIDRAYISCVTAEGHGLRETLFYTLFSRLQVYRTRKDMLQALPCISDGAISLDGGMIRSPGVFSLGTREEIDVNFAICSGDSFLPEDYIQTEKQMKELKWKKERMTEDIHREEAMLANLKFKFGVKKDEFLRFMAQSSPYPMQYPIQATQGRSTPRR